VVSVKVNEQHTIFFVNTEVVFPRDISLHTIYHTILEMIDCTERGSLRLRCGFSTSIGRSSLTVNTAGRTPDWLWTREVANSVTSSVECRPTFKEFVQRCNEYLVDYE
jgi:hypothetical protein